MSRYKNIVFDVGFPKSGRNQISAWILLNRVYCKHSIYHKTSYIMKVGVKASSRKRMKKSCFLPNCLPTISRSAGLLIMKY